MIAKQTHPGGGISLSLVTTSRDAGLTHNAPVGDWSQLCGHHSAWATQNGAGAGHDRWGGVGGLRHWVHLVCWCAAARGRNGSCLHNTWDKAFVIMARRKVAAAYTTCGTRGL